MKQKGLTWVSCWATIFFFLPSLVFKIWDYILQMSWSQKKWLLYLFSGIIIVRIVRARWRIRRQLSDMHSPESLILIVKQRLVKGELSIEEFRQIKEELKQG